MNRPGIGILLLLIILFTEQALANTLPKDFTYLYKVDPTIIQEMRYAENHNFVGRPINGYHRKTCILTNQAALALKKIQTELKAFGYSLKVYDCYRPQIAVNDFMAWSKTAKDQKMKKEFYPKVNKKDLFRSGYISSSSGHTRGSTVDLTIVKLSNLNQFSYTTGQKLQHCYASYAKRFYDNSIDMGTGFDCFDKAAHLSAKKIPAKAQKNRQFLQQIMVKHGFKPYQYEWWHFTLIDEPHPNTYFNFAVE